jgi:glycosyltransferase involved in cell wall biosynthesis
MKKIKIGLFMLPLLTEGGGAEKYFINLAKNLSTKNNPVKIITFDKSSYKIFIRILFIIYKRNFFKKIDISGRESERSIESQLGYAKWIKSSISNLKKQLQKFDVIYSKNEIVELLLLKIIGYKNLPPIIVGVHTPLKFNNPITLTQKLHNILYKKLFYNLLLPPKTLIHCSNRFTKDFSEKTLKKTSELIFYPYSIDKFNYQMKNNKTKIKFDKNKINIAFIGRLTDQKGQDILIKIINKFKTNKKINPKISLNIFGTGDNLTEKFLTDVSQKNSWIRYFGHIENIYIPSILNKQDVLISPARWEVLPFNIIEAQSAGIPVICYDIPGPSDIVIDKKTGIIVKKQEKYITELIKFIDGKYKFDKKTITNNVKNKFNPKIIYKQLEKMFVNYIKPKNN